MTATLIPLTSQPDPPQSARLATATLAAASVGADVDLPPIGPALISIGIVHFGIGAFHRAHQAVFTEDAMAATGQTSWGILGVTGRSEAVVEQLQPQNCLYGVLEKGADAPALRIVGAVRDVAWPGRDSEKVIEMLARPSTHIATLTITEKGYLRGADGDLNLSLPVVQHDVALLEREIAGEAGLPASISPLGLLVRGLARRFRQGGEPFTVLPCDNLVDNGTITHRLVTSFVAAVGRGQAAARDDLLAWLAASVTFPSTMVDRIAPATTEADRQLEGGLLGLRDDALVVAEPFKQWVIEDRFAGPRPRWEQVGAILTSDVAPYERAKLRILNATHSLLAYLGALCGHSTIAQAMTNPMLRDLARRVIDEDILPTLVTPVGMDLAVYRDSVLKRFGNPNLPHTTRQVAMDGSQKLPNRILGSVQDRLQQGETPEGLALAVAAWITYVASTIGGDTILDDPLAELLQATIGDADAVRTDPNGVVQRMLALGQIFPQAVQQSVAFHDAVRQQLFTVQTIMRAARAQA
ncbi:mannitol dehydrogenase family protein [Cryobacterium frigoriphilum]|uniref:Mannitol-1-phosphate 5-dehydrogenase n=1 Tax=Cryobacterium frigoriphilum TaxID=1259150 RepID=A0A4V3IQJ4_9MICO|nr:mannitol dehydrogenase family protein [Cryobacterium frigoriphilum]TFD46888.1 mannitol dehydrogenase family protein [Cryobacterium frigoriphilum]